MHRLISFLGLFVGLCTVCVGQSVDDTSINERSDLQTVFTRLGVEGSFLVYDVTANNYIAYRPDECRRTTLPGSTFDLVNTLIGLESGHLTSPETAIGWDGVKRSVTGWNQGHTLESAFKGSVIPFFQELARRIGPDDMHTYLSRIKYGPTVVSRNTIDRFWLTGATSISLFDQVRFLQAVLTGHVPFSAENRDILRFLMRAASTPSYRLFAKSGWVGFCRDEGVPAPKEPVDLGWYVGYVEDATGKQFIFATRLVSPAPPGETWAEARKLVTIDCLKKLGIICQ